MENQNKLSKCLKEYAKLYAEELKFIANSIVEDVDDSESAKDAWKKIYKFHQTVDSMRDRHDFLLKKEGRIWKD